MVKSGLIFGAVSFLLVLGSATLISPLCAPCVGLIIGLAAGYAAGAFDKPKDSREAVRKGAGAGAIAAAIGLLGGLIGGIINGALLNPSSLQSVFNTIGVSGYSINQAAIWVGQLVGGLCIGLFDIAWMAVLGLAGGALWYQLTGKNLAGTAAPPQTPLISA